MNIFELYTGIILAMLLLLLNIYAFNKSRNLLASQAFRTLSRFSETLSERIDDEKTFFTYLIHTRSFTNTEILPLVQDFIVCDNSGTVTKVFKQPAVSYYYLGYQIDEEEMGILKSLSVSNTVITYGPYYSSLSGESVISFIYKSGKDYYLANVDIRSLLRLMKNYVFLLNDEIIVSTPEGFVVYRSSPMYRSSSIDHVDSVRNLDGIRYLHYRIYNKDLHHTIHLLRQVRTSMVLPRAFLYISIAIQLLWIGAYISRMRLRGRLLWEPLADTVKILPLHDLEALRKTPEHICLEIMDVRNEAANVLEFSSANCHSMEEKQKYFETIIDSNPNILVTTDMKDRIVFANKSCEEFFDQKFTHKNNAREVLQFSEQEWLLISRWKESAEPVFQISEKRYLTETGESYFRVFIFQLLQNKTPEGYGYILNDITAMKLVSDNQWQIRKMETLSILAGGFAHDFNNLMTIILGNLDVYEYISDENKKAELIRSIRDATIKSSELIKQILIFSNQDKMTIQPVVLEDIIARIIKMSSKTMTRNIQLIPNLKTESTTVFADVNQFMQVFLNLIMNARDAIIQKLSKPETDKTNVGRIEISSEIVYIDRSQADRLTLAEGNYIKICISDDGVGISPEIRHLVFDPFFTTKSRGTEKGVGLGLSVAYSIIKNFRGSIDIQSLPDVGTNIYLFLPLPSEETGIPEESFVKSLGVTGKILLIDDDEDVLSLGEQFLLLSGFEVTTAKNGREAVNRLKDGKFDLAIVDMIMPEYDGWYFLEYVQNSTTAIPVIVTTGFFEGIDSSKLKGYLFIRGFLDKPFTLDNLLNEIRRILEENGANKGKE